MKINRNMSAVLTNKQMHRTENKLAASMERLSTGYKINKPGDNPSGMAISNKMRAQIRALDQAEDNTADGISVMQIADGALNETTSILQRIRELSVQAANGTNTLQDRESIQAEIDQLVKEVDRIASDTEYNSKTLLDGSSDVRVYASPKEASRIRISDEVPADTYTFEVKKNATQPSYTFPKAEDMWAKLGAAGTDPSEVEMSINGVGVDLDPAMKEDEYLNAIRNAAQEAGCEVEQMADGSIEVRNKNYGSKAELVIAFEENLAAEMGGAEKIAIYGEDAEVDLKSPFGPTATAIEDGNRVKIQDQNGFSMEFLLSAAAPLGDIELNVTDLGKMVIQTGGNEYQTINVRIPSVSAESMYLDYVDVTSVNGAQEALGILDDALNYLNEVRSRIGAYQNRLEYAESSDAQTSENMTSAYSTLIDTDMATEMTEYTQQNVLEQAAISVLSQANQMPQQVLSLLQQ